MDLWTFIVEILGKVAWPIVVLILGLKYRTSIAKLIDRMRRLKYGELEGEFEVPKLEPAKEETPQGQLPAPKAQLQLPAPEVQEPIAEPELVEYAPTGAVINAWAKFEDAMRREATRLDLVLDTERNVSAPTLINRLNKVGVLDKESAAAALSLRALRNYVAHDPSEAARLSEKKAAEFVDTITELSRRLELGTDRLRVEMLLAHLKAEKLADVRVGTLAAIGVSADPDAASAMARFRMGKWAASYGSVRMMVSDRDAALLVGRGAKLVDDVEA